MHEQADIHKFFVVTVLLTLVACAVGAITSGVAGLGLFASIIALSTKMPGLLLLIKVLMAESNGRILGLNCGKRSKL